RGVALLVGGGGRGGRDRLGGAGAQVGELTGHLGGIGVGGGLLGGEARQAERVRSERVVRQRILVVVVEEARRVVREVARLPGGRRSRRLGRGDRIAEEGRDRAHRRGLGRGLGLGLAGGQRRQRVGGRRLERRRL